MVSFYHKNVAVLFIISIIFSVQSRADDLLNTAPNPTIHKPPTSPEVIRYITIDTARHGRGTFTQHQPQTSFRNNSKIIHIRNSDVHNKSNRRKIRSIKKYQQPNINYIYTSSNQYSDYGDYKYNSRRDYQGYNGNFIHYNINSSKHYLNQFPVTNYRNISIQQGGYNNKRYYQTRQQPHDRYITSVPVP